jgi:multidrug efflux pump subunit AcrB
MGTQFRAFGTSISFTMIGSLIIAFTLVPLLAVRLLRGRCRSRGAMQWLNQRYRALLDRVLDHRLATAGFALTVFAAGGWVLAELPRELMPEEDNRFIRMGISTPGGSRWRSGARSSARRSRSSWTGPRSSRSPTCFAFSGGNFSNLFMTLKPFSGRGNPVHGGDLGEAIQDALPVIPGVEWRQRRGFGRVSGVQVRLVGESTSELARLADAVELHLQASVEGISQLDNSLESGNEEIRVRVDRRAAERQGLTSEQVAQAVSGALRGQVATRFRSGEREVDVLLQLRDEDRVSIAQMGNLAVGRWTAPACPWEPWPTSSWWGDPRTSSARTARRRHRVG